MKKENLVSVLKYFGDDVSTILHLGAGKMEPIILRKRTIIVHVDRSYGSCGMSIQQANELFNMKVWNTEVRLRPEMNLYVTADIFEFLDMFPLKFDGILANRIFEHMFYDSGEVGRLLSSCHYMLNDINKSEMIIIVPNHMILADRLLQLNSERNIDESVITDILQINTEFCNSRCDPHGSIWSPELVGYYITQEGNWKMEKLIEQITWAGRDCYMLVKLVKS